MPGALKEEDDDLEGLRSLPLYHFIHQPLQPPPVKCKPPLLLLLHGLAGSEFDLYGLAPYLDPRFLILSLRAPVTLRPDRYAWFEVKFSDSGPVIKPEQAEASRLRLISFIKLATAVYEADPDQVYVMGFSQGAIMSLALALTRPELLAGVVALSGRTLPELFSSDNPIGGHLAPPIQLKDFPLMVAHGRWDPVLSVEYGRQTKKRFSSLPVSMIYKEYDMAHDISDECLEDVDEWLTARLNQKDA